MKYEASLGVVHQAENVSGFLHRNNIHESSRVVMVGADFAVNLYAAFHANLHALLVGKGVLKPVTEDDAEGEALTLLVRPS